MRLCAPVAVIVACGAIGGGFAGADATLFVVRAGGPDGVRIDAEALRDGESRIFARAADGDFIGVILPPGPGGSAGLDRMGDGARFIASCEGEQLVVQVEAQGRAPFVLGSGVASEMRGWRTHVSVVGREARTSAVIDGYRAVAPDTSAPVFDLFGGRIPLGPNDFVVTTFTTTTTAHDTTRGEAALVFSEDAGSGSGHLLVAATLADGSEAWFVLDTAAEGSWIVRDALPADAEITPVEQTQRKAGEVTRLAQTVPGATGAVTPLGATTLERLDLGAGLRFQGVALQVLDSFPRFGDRRVVGIVGQDLLRRAPAVEIRYPEGGRPGALRLLDAPADKAGHETPFSIGRRNLFIRAAVDSHAAHLVIDTGAPETILTEASAELLGLEPTEDSVTVRGLGDGSTTLRRATAGRIEVGGASLRDEGVRVGPLAVFDTVAPGQAVGLLGNSTLRRLGGFVIDYRAGVVRFGP